MILTTAVVYCGTREDGSPNIFQEMECTLTRSGPTAKWHGRFF